METNYNDGLVFSKGIDFKELMSSGAEFHINPNFEVKNKQQDLLFINNDPLGDDTSEDSDTETVLKNMEQKMEVNLLSSPEYKSFDDLALKMTDCVPSGEVKILIIEEGDGPLVPTDALVTIHYAAYWEKNDKPFDSSLVMNCGAPVTFLLGTNTYIPGLEIGLTTVKGPTARFHLLLEPTATWGEKGVLPRIRPERTLFIVSLLKVADLSAVYRFNDLPSEEQKKFTTTLRTVNAANTNAKELFKKRLYHKAIKNYLKSIYVLQKSSPQSEDEINEIKRILAQVYINLVVCYCKLSMPNKVLQFCDKLGRVTDIEKHCKGLFYYGKAFTMLGQYDEAMKYYKKALRLERNNPDIGKAMADLENLIKKSKETEKAMWKTAFKNEAITSTTQDDLDDDFKASIRSICENLANSTDYHRFDLAEGLMKKELDYIKRLISDFQGLALLEDSHGGRKVTIVKKNS